MNTSPHFIGDTDQRLIMEVQKPLYPNLVTYFFELPRMRFVKSCQLLDILSKPCSFVQNISYDHVIYVEAYNLLAAYYRHSYHQLVQDKHYILPDLPDDLVATGYTRDYDERLLLQDCYQGNLFEPTSNLIKCLKQNWVKFMYHEVLRLTYNNRNFTLASIVAALCNFVLKDRINNIPVIDPSITLVYLKDLASRARFAQDLMNVIILNEYHMHDWIYDNELSHREELRRNHEYIINNADTFKTLQNYLDEEFWIDIFDGS